MLSEEQIHEYFARVPFNRFLGYKLHSCEKGAAELSMPLRSEYLQEAGVIQGGLVAALADTATAYALVRTLAEDERMIGVEYKVNFVAPARLDEGDLVARSRIVRRGRTLGVSEVEVSQGEKVVVVGLFTYLFMKKEPAE